MQALRQLGGALILAAGSIALIFGSISLSLAEDYKPVVAPTPTFTPTFMIAPAPMTVTYTASPLPIPFTSTAVPSATFTPPPPACSTPLGWNLIIVQSGDTLESLARQYNVSAEQLRAGNCLLSDSLPVGSTFSVPYIPKTPTNVVAPKQCGAPATWVKAYVVKHGDTLFSIAQSYGVNVETLMAANCKSNSDIRAGEYLYVPNVAPRTPTTVIIIGDLNTLTSTPTVYLTEPFTETVLPYTETKIATSTPLPLTNTPMPTITPPPTLAPTLQPTLSPFPTNTP